MSEARVHPARVPGDTLNLVQAAALLGVSRDVTLELVMRFDIEAADREAVQGVSWRLDAGQVAELARRHSVHELRRLGGVTKTLQAEWIRPAGFGDGRPLPPARVCQWPQWGDEPPPWPPVFCGKATTRGFSYCQEHARMCVRRLAEGSGPRQPCEYSPATMPWARPWV